MDFFCALGRSLGHSKNLLVANEAGNTHSGQSKKAVKGDFGELPIEIPRDCVGTFEPQTITRHQARWCGFEGKILLLHARGMTVREIQSHLQKKYGSEVSSLLISSVSSVTYAVLDEVKTWQGPGPWTPCTPWSIWTIPTPICETMAQCASKPYTLPYESTWTASWNR